MMQEDRKSVDDGMIKYVLRKLNYNKDHIERPQEAINSFPTLKNDLEELRNLRNRVLKLNSHKSLNDHSYYSKF